jgi:hypothetical protein
VLGGATVLNGPEEEEEQAQPGLPGERAMYHTIEFSVALWVDLGSSPQHWLERILIRRGTRLRAQIKPYVVETEDGPVEVADLFFADGTTIRMVRFESFSFVE